MGLRLRSKPVIKDRQATLLSPWVKLMARTVAFDKSAPAEIYHSLQQADYVTVLAETPAGEIVLVKQYRPALEAITLELPGGLRDGEGGPAVCAARELEEETGFRCPTPPILLGSLDPDSGRLENRLWCFYAGEIEPVSTWQPEPGLERLLVSKREFMESIQSGKFTMALHIAVVALALLHNKLKL